MPSTLSPLGMAHMRPKAATPASLHRKRTMSITQTYFLAHKARGKLSREAALPDHNLRLLVGHANLLDSLMLELADAEREQELWFNHSVCGASRRQEKERHIQWAENMVEEPENDWQVEDADTDSSDDEDSEYESESADEEVEMTDVPLRRVASHAPFSARLRETPHSLHVEDDDDEDDFVELTRSPLRSASSPELYNNSDSSEEDPMPPSPPSTLVPTFSIGSQKQVIDTTLFYNARQEEKHAFYERSYYIPSRDAASMVSAIPVY